MIVSYVRARNSVLMIRSARDPVPQLNDQAPRHHLKLLRVLLLALHDLGEENRRPEAYAQDPLEAEENSLSPERFERRIISKVAQD